MKRPTFLLCSTLFAVSAWGSDLYLISGTVGPCILPSNANCPTTPSEVPLFSDFSIYFDLGPNGPNSLGYFGGTDFSEYFIEDLSGVDEFDITRTATGTEAGDFYGFRVEYGNEIQYFPATCPQSQSYCQTSGISGESKLVLTDTTPNSSLGILTLIFDSPELDSSKIVFGNPDEFNFGLDSTFQIQTPMGYDVVYALLDASVQSVPEPGTFALGLLAMAGIGGLKRFRMIGKGQRAFLDHAGRLWISGNPMDPGPTRRRK